MTWSITLDWNDRRHISDENGESLVKRGDRQMFACEGTFWFYIANTAVGLTMPGKWLNRIRGRGFVVHVKGKSSTPLPDRHEWPKLFFEDITFRAKSEDHQIELRLTDPAVEVIHQDGEGFILCIYGVRDKPAQTPTDYFAYSAVLCMRCGGRDQPGVVIRGAVGHVIAICDNCRTIIGGCDAGGAAAI